MHGRLDVGARPSRVTVAVPGGSLVVVQEPQPSLDVVAALIQRAAGSDVAIDDRSAELALFAFPGRTAAPDAAGTASTTPSCLGAGVDVFALAEDHDRLLRSFGTRFQLIDLEGWRGTP